MSTTNSELADATRKLYWPRVLFPADLAEAFGISVRTASQLLREGGFGPYVQIGRKRGVLKESLLEFLESIQVDPRVPVLSSIRGIVEGENEK